MWGIGAHLAVRAPSGFAGLSIFSVPWAFGADGGRVAA